MRCRYFAETSSSTLELRLVSPASAEVKPGGHLGLVRPACVE